MFFRKLRRDPSETAFNELDKLESEIAKYQSLIENAPLQLLEQKERERTTIPAPDDLPERIRERRFYAELSKGQLINVRRYRTRNTALFVLLLAATASLCWWIYSELVRNGVIS